MTECERPAMDIAEPLASLEPMMSIDTMTLPSSMAITHLNGSLHPADVHHPAGSEPHQPACASTITLHCVSLSSTT
jgi:hypothetical protein